MKGFILYPTYNVENNKAYVQIYGRLENGESFLTITRQKPYFFIESSKLAKAKKLEKFDFEETNFTNFKGKKVSKIVLNNPADVPKLRDKFSKKKIECYEADIRFAYRFLFDNDLKGTVNIEGTYEKGDYVDRVYREPKITSDSFSPKLSILSLDIETSQDQNRLYSIALYSKNIKKVLIISKDKVQGAENYSSEKELLESFKGLIRKEDPDIITGWNLIDFDLLVLKNLFDKNKIKFSLGRSDDLSKLSIENDFFKTSKATIVGRQALDALNLIRDPYLKDAPSVRAMKFENYRLDTIAGEILGKKKLISKDNKVEEIERQFKEDKKSLAKYNLQDAELVYMILEKTELIDLVIQRSMLTGMPIDRVNASIASLDSLYIRETIRRKLVIPTGKFSVKEKSITGGYVMSSKPGIYDNILVFDFKSLYPSVMMTFNIDPYSFREKKEKNCIESPNKAYFKNEDGIIPKILERLFKERAKAKQQKKELASQAIKITMNCFSQDTEILTEHGIRNIKEVKLGDRVYSINPANNSIGLQATTKVFSYNYKGDMIRMKSTVVDYLVTPNHRFLVSTEKNGSYMWKTAQELYDRKKEYWLPLHSKIKGHIIEEISLEELCKKHKIKYGIKGKKLQKGPKHSSINKIYKIKDWLSLLGWYISEGCIYTSKEKRYPGKVSWRGITKIMTISQKIEPNRKEIKKLFERMNFKYCSQKSGISISNHILSEVLEKEIGKGTNSKRIPLWVYNLDPNLLVHLFKSMMEGDGDRNGRRYSTKSRKLAEDFMRLVRHLGWYSTIFIEKGRYNGKEYTMYRVRINKNRGIRPYLHPQRNMNLEKFTGKVFCIEVQPHHTILAGRDYKLNFCGQSMFGSLASPASRFFNMKIANAITHFGQSLIKSTAKKIEEDYKNVEVIYSDTDSIFVSANLTSSSEAEKLGKTIEGQINNFYKKHIKEKYSRESKLELEFEKNYIKFLMPKIRGGEEGAKKRYAGLLKQDGKEKIDFVGLESARRDWTEASKKFQLELLNRIFHKEEVSEYVKKFVKELKDGMYDDLLIYRKAISKDLKEYTKINPQHVQAAKKLKKITSNIIEYVITTDGPEPIQNQKHKIDYDHYINKQIKPIADSVLCFYNVSFDDLLRSTTQHSLFDFKK